MKTRLIAIISLTTLLLIFLVVGCNKEFVQDSAPGASPEAAPPRPAFNTNCSSGPDYGSSLICPRWKGPGNDHIITPLNNPGAGTYFAMPMGLMIDSLSGAINISRSETGARYLVGFISAGTKDTCMKELVLSGISYVDSVYVLSNNDSLAIPYYNADPSTISVCGNNDHPGPANNDCEFDDGDDDDNGNGQADEPPPGQRANDQHVRVRTTNGVINLRQSLEDGALGANPRNGDSKDVTIFYRLSDCSNKALQKITVRLIYYERVSDIPQTLAADVRSKRNDFFLSRFISSPLAGPRPPQVIITRYAD